MIPENLSQNKTKQKKKMGRGFLRTESGLWLAARGGESILHLQGVDFFPTLKATLPEKKYGWHLDFSFVGPSAKKPVSQLLGSANRDGNHKTGCGKGLSVLH